ncbi:MAG TPA: hemerythrin family protein [Gemmatimonadales bacterium]|nr:hemerythrin family protein [Gemmatimonadales bacterium]
MPIAWRPAMAVGHEMIDRDHRGLIESINQVEAALLGEGTAAALAGVLDGLGDYTKAHFEREEGLMNALGYYRAAEHRESHRRLRAQLLEIRKAVQSAKADEVGPAERERLVALLRSWLLDHVLKEDLLMRAVLSDRR